jgi:hypothetical protein
MTRRLRILTAAGVATISLALVPAGAAAKSCPEFTVGKANSTSYPDGRLPARGARATGVSCRRLRSLARAFQRGALSIPDDARGFGEWGPSFDITHSGLDWSCRLWWVGGSGPSYKFRCRHGSRSARWSVG